MGWTEPTGPSAALVARRELEAAARAVVKDRSVENHDRLAAAVERLDTVDASQPRPGAYC